MADLKKNFTLLIVYLLTIFSLDHMRYEGQLIIDIQVEFYWVVALAIISILLVPVIRNMSIYRLLIFWGVVFISVSLAFSMRRGYIGASITLISFLFLEVAVWVTYHVNQALNAAESLVEGLATYSFPHRAQNLDGAEESIDVEFSRSRRYDRPLMLLLIAPEEITDEKQLAYQELRKAILKHFAVARIGQIITDTARKTDLIIHDPKTGHFFVLCPEMELRSAKIFAERIQESISNNLKVSVKWGSAAFPAEALTMDDLVKIAQDRIEDRIEDRIKV